MLWIQNCETCKYYDVEEGMCVNGESEYCAEWAEPKHSCDKWEKEYAEDG